MSDTYCLCRLDDVEPDGHALTLLMSGEAIHGDILGHATTAKLLETDIDPGDMFRVVASMQHKMLDAIDVPRLAEKDINDLKTMFDTAAETLHQFNLLLIKLGKGSQTINDAVNTAQKAFDEHIEELLKDKKQEAEPQEDTSQ